MKLTKLLLLLILAVLGFFAAPAYADLYPGYIALDPQTCTPPGPPSEGVIGYGPLNPYPNGIYWDPTHQMWFYPDGIFQGEGGERDLAAIAVIEELLARPAWATDGPVNGTYYFNGGFWNSSNWYEPGYYFPNEIW